MSTPKQSFLVAGVGANKGLLAQVYAINADQAERSIEAAMVDFLGEEGEAQCINADATPGLWLEGDAAYIRSVIEAQH